VRGARRSRVEARGRRGRAARPHPGPPVRLPHSPTHPPTHPPIHPSLGLDPTWEETFEFPVADESATKCFVKFLMGAEGEEKQIGDECEQRGHARACGRGIEGVAAATGAR
jgi:hypothetical protein